MNFYPLAVVIEEGFFVQDLRADSLMAFQGSEFLDENAREFKFFFVERCFPALLDAFDFVLMASLIGDTPCSIYVF